MITAAEAADERSVIVQSIRENGGNYLSSLAWLAYRENTMRLKPASRSLARRARRIILEGGNKFIEDAKVKASDVRFHVARGSLVFQVIPQCPPESVFSQITGERTMQSCRHHWLYSATCERRNQSCKHGCTARMGVIGCSHAESLSFAGEDHR